jgi:hypothetical protein
MWPLTVTVVTREVTPRAPKPIEVEGVLGAVRPMAEKRCLWRGKMGHG